MADKGHVQLDAVERQEMDVLQRRVARPEVVEEDPDPHLPKPVERRTDPLQVVDKDALGHLDQNAMF